MTITPYVPPTGLSGLPSGIWSGTQGLPVLPFLPGQTPNVTKAPLWSTQVIRTASGRERRTAFWPYPLWQFELSYEVIRHRPTNDELFTLWEFFNVNQGQYGTWLFVDPSDNQVLVASPAKLLATAGTNIGTNVADGTNTTFQFSRPINSFVEPVYDVYSPTVLDNGSASGSYTVGPNGLLTFSAPPTSGHTITWYGYYYFGCRFLQDDASFEAMATTLWSGKAVKFTSIRA